ncbi:MAG TPA: CHAT domain-containing protein [Pyrinomonadaceae bacterium]
MPTLTRRRADAPRSFIMLSRRNLLLLLLIFSLPAVTLVAQTMPGIRKAEAERLVNEADELSRQGTQQSAEAAANKYKEAVSIFNSIKDVPGEVLALINMGLNYRRSGEKQKALDTYSRAITTARAGGDRRGEAHALYNLGAAYSMEPGGTHKALDYAKQSVTLFIAGKDIQETFDALFAIGTLHRDLEEERQAIDYFTQVLPKLNGAGDRLGEAVAHYELGMNYRLLAEYEMALDHSLQARSLFRVAGNRLGEVNSLNLVGLLYGSLGEHDTATGYFTQVLSISKEHGMRDSEGAALGNLGLLSMVSGNHEKALDYHLQALPLNGVDDREGMCARLLNIGDVYSLMNNSEKALDYYTQALTAARAIKHRGLEANALIGIGTMYLKSKKWREAREQYDQALSLSRAIGDENGKISAQDLLAYVERDSGNHQQALKLVEASLQLNENSRGRIFNQDLRTTYSSYRQTEYEFYIDLLMRLHKQSPSEGYDARAFEANERRQSRTLVELLAAAKVDVRRDVDPTLLESERTLRRQINAKAAQLQAPGGQRTEEEVKSLNGEIATLNTELQRVEGAIARSSPRYAKLTRPRALTLREVQTQVLDPETLLLEYSLGDDVSYLWAVTPTSVTSYELPARKELEKLAREFHGTLASYSPPTSGGAQKKRDIRGELQKQSVARVAGQLSRILLGPVAPLLGNKRLLVVADGSLLYVPFAALPIPTGSSGVAVAAPLITEHEIINSPSSSTLALLRSEAASRRPATKTLAVLADPVFERSDERLTPPGSGNATGQVRPCAGTDRRFGQVVGAAAKQAGVLRDGRCIERLPGTRLEAEELVKLVPPGQAQMSLGFAANLATATSSELSHYRYVHFATHGFLSNERPAELSGIVLSLFDEKGVPQDGFLRVRDIYTLKLAADVVVLSACETGLGKELGGEGLIGLTRGFMYAGAPRVVAGMWNVDDNETAELMTRFYRGMLVDKLRPSKALQAAQVSMLKEKQFAASFNWAAFIIQGEWR